MAKLVLDEVASGYNLSVLNNNFQKIAQELQDKVLYRDNPTGEPNQMEVNLDLNSNKILNVAAGEVDTDVATLGQVKQILDNNLTGGGSVVSGVPPKNPNNGLRWTRCADMISFIWYEDGDSGQWVEDNPSMGGTTTVSLPTFADEAAALAGGLATNSLYKTPTGEVRIKL